MNYANLLLSQYLSSLTPAADASEAVELLDLVFMFEEGTDDIRL